MSRPSPTPHGNITPTAWFLLAACVLAPPTTSAAVYRCASSGDPPHFSQFPCGDGSAVVVEPLHTVSIPPLSDAEQRLLHELDAQRLAEQEQRDEVRRRAALEARARRDERRERCHAAKTARAALEQQRRKGYSLDEARALDRRDARLEQQERENC